VISRLLSLILFSWMSCVHADLYRWIDPETGSVRFSSYPPPWYGDPAQERRAPEVEHIPQRGPGAAPEMPAPAQGGAAEPAAGTPATLEQRRKALLARILEVLTNPIAAGPEEAMRGLLAIAEPVREYRSVETVLAQADPAGRVARHKEREAFVASLDARRRSMAEDLRKTPPPAASMPPDQAQRVIRQLQAKLVSYGGVIGALKALDPAGDAARTAEMRALEQQLTAAWKAPFDFLKQTGAQR
jgi:hypothetical protein